MPSHSGSLPHLGLLRFAGADAIAFLQGQITNDARRLAAGHGLLAAVATPQGRVLAVLQLLPAADGVLAILPRELVEPTAERLRKFVLRAKLTIEIPGERLAVAGATTLAALTAAGLEAPAAPDGYRQTSLIGIGRVQGDPRRFWIVAPPAALAAHGLAGDPDDAARFAREWRLADVRAGVAQVYAATREAFIPQMLNLDLLGAISFQKGCYTGQEIVARTQHLGRIKRRLLRVRTRVDAPLGASVRLPDGRVARLTELQPAEDGYEGLAVAPLAAADAAEAPEAAGEAAAASAADAPIPAELLPLPYPLTVAPAPASS
jgi:folate-binding protein YgfZ